MLMIGKTRRSWSAIILRKASKSSMSATRHMVTAGAKAVATRRTKSGTAPANGMCG